MKGKHLWELWDEAVKGSGFKNGEHPDDAVVMLVSGKKGLAIIPNGNKEQILNLADGFSVMAKAGAIGVKMIEIDKVHIDQTFGDRFQIVGGGCSIQINPGDNEFVKEFLQGRTAKKRELRLVLSLSDVHK